MRHVMMMSAFALLTALAVGCGDGSSSAPAKPASSAVADNKHSGWWCDEHGIPEEECSMCSNKYAKACKDKGDWCDKHDRAKSQCFVCDPKLQAVFAEKYRTKYGKEPPAIEVEAKK